MTSDNLRQVEVLLLAQSAGDFRGGRQEPRGWGCRGGLESVRFGTLNENYYTKYTSDKVNYRICAITLSEGL